jgi:hypothetical protein
LSFINEGENKDSGNSLVPIYSFNNLSEGWQLYNTWDINYPKMLLFGAAQYTMTGDKEEEHYLLISGGIKYNKQAHMNKEIPVVGSWLYRRGSNSWEKVEGSQNLNSAMFPAMISLCSRKVIRVGGGKSAQGVEGVNSSFAWLFDTKTAFWSQISINGNAPDWSFTEVEEDTSDLLFPITIPDPSSTCECKMDIAFLPCLKVIALRGMYRMLCTKQNDTEEYSWEKLWAPSRSKQSREDYWTDWQYCSVATSYKNNLIVYSPNRSEVWYFMMEGRYWEKLNVLLTINYTDEEGYNGGSIRAWTIPEKNLLIVFATRLRSILLFDLIRNTCRIDSVVGDFPVDIVDTFGADAPLELDTRISSWTPLSSTQVIVYIADRTVGEISVWTLQTYNYNVWSWNRVRKPDIVPEVRYGATTSFVRNYLFIAGGHSGGHPSSKGWLWRLDLTTMKWWLFATKPKNLTYNKYYFGSTWIRDCLVMIVEDNRNLILFNQTSKETIQPPRRVPLACNRKHFTLLTLSDSTAVMFGGADFPNSYKNYEITKATNEMWILQIQHQSLPHWHQIYPDETYSSWPKARFGHGGAIIDGVLYIYGGMDMNLNCLEDMWSFDFREMIWRKVEFKNQGPDTSQIKLCLVSATFSPGHLWVAIVCQSPYVLSPESPCRPGETTKIYTWLYIVHLHLWHKIQTLVISDENIDIYGNMVKTKIDFWNGYLIFLHSANTKLFYLPVQCPDGFVSPNISEFPCSICPNGAYKEVSICKPCPRGLTTSVPGANNILECKECTPGYCKFGRCLVDNNQTPTCDCYPGFSGSRCQIPTFYLIGIGLLIVVALASAGITAYLFLLRRKQRNERHLRKQLNELTDVWQIEEDELSSLERIASGTYGDVFRGIYRNSTVAVKRLRVPEDEQMNEEFEREIVFMRTIRHRNIVLFLGAGKFSEDNIPFLVTEFMENGSLRDILENMSIELSYEQRVAFALNAANGMHFLHCLEPPRIHRDLKSPNLLVSSCWTVRVADFGLGRPVPQATGRRSTKKGKMSDGGLLPLLQCNPDLSFQGIGTCRWRAPEITLRMDYGTAVDVYR